MKTLNTKHYQVKELDQKELLQVDGGGFVAGAIAFGKAAAVVGVGLGVLGAGALVGYALYKTVQYMSKK